MIDLVHIFGPDSQGETLAERAETSRRRYVRSQVQLAEYSDGATGVTYNAARALEIFGLETLTRVANDGAAPLVSDPAEPARTLREQRQRLGFSFATLAAVSNIPEDDLRRVEQAGETLPFRQLERLGQDLALDERVLGMQPGARGDGSLRTRLRDLSGGQARNNYFISALTDAAWTIRRQDELNVLLGQPPAYRRLFDRFDANYDIPTYERGYALAERTRKLIGIDAESPISSLRALIEDRLGIALIYTNLGENVAGATIVNGDSRGIALSDEAPDRFVLSRRMTLAHELGHLLWDSRDRLETVRVETNARAATRDREPIEIRANAFAVGLLAPRAAVLKLNAELSSSTVVERLVIDYGLSPVAAAHHLANVCEIPFASIKFRRSAAQAIERHWGRAEAPVEVTENLIRQSRNGTFAALVVKALEQEEITIDNAASWLRLSSDAVEVLMRAKSRD